MKTVEHLILGLAVCITAALSGCDGGKTSASITGYDHMKDISIASFSVNEGMGPNVSAEGGGKETCCVLIPREWRPGIKLKVTWEYDKLPGDPTPLPPAQKAEVDLPKYKMPGQLQVHFYNNHKIIVVVSDCSPAHPFYPLSPNDLAPWVSSSSKDEMREAAQHGGGAIDC